MWYSFHIYGISPEEFLETMNRNRLDRKYFFINYIDYNGFHIRLRLFLQHAQEKREYQAALRERFPHCKVVEKIYDPEYNVYGDSLNVYEEYSAALSAYLVEHGRVDRMTMLLTVRKLLHVFDRADVRYLRFHVAWWEKGTGGHLISRIQASPQTGTGEHTLDRKLERLIDEFVVPGIPAMPEASKDRLCFQFIHMTLNKMNCTIAEEAAILKWFLKTKEENPNEISGSLLL